MTTELNVYDLIADYIRFVYEWDENDKKKIDLDEYLIEDFKFSAANNWESGFDFVDWLLADSPDMRNHYKVEPKVKCLWDCISFKESCSVIDRIITYYTSNFGHSVPFTHEITCESVLRHLVYVEINEKSTEELREILGLE